MGSNPTRTHISTTVTCPSARLPPGNAIIRLLSDPVRNWAAQESIRCSAIMHHTYDVTMVPVQTHIEKVRGNYESQGRCSGEVSQLTS